MAQRFKDPALSPQPPGSLRWRGFDPGLGISICCGCVKKKKKKNSVAGIRGGEIYAPGHY